MRKWDKEEKAAAVRIFGLVIGVAAVFTLLGTVSYLFTWKQDMGGSDLSNAGGTLGYGFSRFLVADCFGLGSLALVVILGSLAVRLMGLRWRFPLVRTVVLTLVGTLVASLTLSFVGSLVGARTVFGGGLGGRCGMWVIDLAVEAMGHVVTGCILAVLCVLFAVMSSRRILHWLANLGKVGPDSVIDLAIEPAVEPESEPVGELSVEEVSESAADPLPTDILPTDPLPADILPAEDTDDVIDGEEETTPQNGASLDVVEGEDLSAENAEPLPRIDNRLDPPDGLPRFKFPELSILDDHSEGRFEIQREELERNKNQICMTLADYKIKVSNVVAVVGPTVTLYKVTPAPGVKIASIRSLQDDIAMSLKAKGVRITLLTDAVGIEVANDHPSMVPVKSLFNSEQYRNTKAALPVAIGYAITSQQVKVFDLADAPHLLIAGATQQGKSVGLNVIISSLLFSKHPSELKFVFIDPKMVEFPAYKALLKHYLAVLPTADDAQDEVDNAIVTKAKDAERILRSLCVEMDERYELMAHAGAVKISIYNDKYKDRKLNPQHGHRFLPYIVAVVDEYADLTMTVGASPETKAASKSITNSIIRLAQKGRAAGIHIILATQRPSVDVISGIIKTNFPMRIAFRTSARIDSMTIIDAPGAEKLIGKGDMLIAAGCDNERAQCGFISSDEIDRLTGFIGAQTKHGQCYNTPYYLPIPQDNTSEGGSGSADMSDLDERFEEAARLVVTNQKASTSFLQTRMAMGFAKSSRVMSQLEAANIIGPADGAKPREILVPDLDSLEQILETIR